MRGGKEVAKGQLRKHIKERGKLRGTVEERGSKRAFKGAVEESCQGERWPKGG